MQRGKNVALCGGSHKRNIQVDQNHTAKQKHNHKIKAVSTL